MTRALVRRGLTVVLLLALGVQTVSAAAGVAAGHEATVASSDGLNIRTESNGTSDVLAVAADGDFVNVLDGPRVENGSEWFRVEYDGTIGWVAGSFLGPARDRAAVSTRGGRGSVQADKVWLPVPYYSQFDGSAYQSGNCGPSTLTMVLGAFGQGASVQELRRAANRIQGTAGVYDAGVGIDVLADLAAGRGLTVRGLRGNGGFDRWSFDEVRQALRNGNLVVPQLHLASLPGHERSNRSVDHFIVITGYEGNYFYYNDSAFSGIAGKGLAISQDGLALAWKRSDFPFAAFSLGPGPGMVPLVAPPPAPRPIAAPPPSREPALDVALAAARAADLPPVGNLALTAVAIRVPRAADAAERAGRVRVPSPAPAVQVVADAITTTYDATVTVGVEHVSSGVQRISETPNGPELWLTLATAGMLSIFGARRQLLRLPIWRRARGARRARPVRLTGELAAA